MSRSPLAGIAWMALASALFAVMNLLVRLCSARMPWAEVAAARSLVGAAVVVLVARAQGARLTTHDRRLSWGRSLFGTGALLCGFYAMGFRGLPLGDAVTLAALSPIFIALLAPLLLGERGGLRVWVATPVAFVGVALVAGPSFSASDAGAQLAAAVATLGALLTAMAMIWLRRLGRGAAKESPEAIVVHFSLVAALASSLFAARDLRAPDAASALLLAATGLAGGLAQLAMTRAYALERAARVGPVSYLGVVLSHLGSAALLGERVGPVQVAGAALVVGAGVVLAVAALRDPAVLEAT